MGNTVSVLDMEFDDVFLLQFEMAFKKTKLLVAQILVEVAIHLVVFLNHKQNLVWTVFLLGKVNEFDETSDIFFKIK